MTTVLAGTAADHAAAGVIRLLEENGPNTPAALRNRHPQVIDAIATVRAQCSARQM